MQHCIAKILTICQKSISPRSAHCYDRGRFILTRQESPLRPSQPLLRDQHGDYLVVAREPFITYEDGDLPWLTYCGKTRPAGRGEGRTTRFIADVVEQLRSGRDVLLVSARAKDSVEFARQVIRTMTGDIYFRVYHGAFGPWEFSNGSKLRATGVCFVEDVARGLRPSPLIMFDHYAEEYASPRCRIYARMHNAFVLKHKPPTRTNNA